MEPLEPLFFEEWNFRAGHIFSKAEAEFLKTPLQ